MTRNQTTDANQDNVTAATLARRIRRAALVLDDASDRYDVTVLRLDGYLSERAAAAGEEPRSITVAAIRGWMPGTGRYSVTGATVDTVADDKPRTLNLYKAARVTIVTRRTGAHLALRAAAYQAAEAAERRAMAAAELRSDGAAAFEHAIAAAAYAERYWRAVTLGA